MASERTVLLESKADTGAELEIVSRIGGSQIVRFISFSVMDDRISEIKPDGYSPRGIEFPDAADIESEEVGGAAVCHIYFYGGWALDNAKDGREAFKAHEAWAHFPEYAESL